MGDLRFDSDNADEFRRPSSQEAGTDFTGKLVTWGIVSNRQQAEYLMIGLAIAIALLAYFVYSSSTG